MWQRIKQYYEKAGSWSTAWTARQERLWPVYERWLRRKVVRPLWRQARVRARVSWRKLRRSTVAQNRKAVWGASAIITILAVAAWWLNEAESNIVEHLQSLWSAIPLGRTGWVVGGLVAVTLLVWLLKSTSRREAATGWPWGKIIGWGITGVVACLVLPGLIIWLNQPATSTGAAAQTEYLPPPSGRKVVILPNDEALYTIIVTKEGTPTYRFPLWMMARIQAVEESARFKVVTEDGEFWFAPEHSDLMPGPTSEATLYSLSNEPVVIEIDIYPISKKKTLEKKPSAPHAFPPVPAIPLDPDIRLANGLI